MKTKIKTLLFRILADGTIHYSSAGASAGDFPAPTISTLRVTDVPPAESATNVLRRLMVTTLIMDPDEVGGSISHLELVRLSEGLMPQAFAPAVTSRKALR